ncbi:superoxide dismutase family protein [Paenibacillus filicis]|uniref:Superoxide dismutase [Cu-Zn] n=1 Tax=Paenibacillus filicis TaxID=669464 RepID=A0ABU9DI62_9BACL
MNRNTNKRIRATAALLALLLAAGCESGMLPWMGANAKPKRGHDAHTGEGSTAVMAAESSMISIPVKLAGSKGEALGEVFLSPSPEGVRIQGQAQGLVPGEHGFHVHENGACTPPDFASAGGHFNPGGHVHGTKSEGGPHAGDLPNLVADAQGKAKIDIVAGAVTLEKGKPHSLLKDGGTSLVIHEKADDYKSPPAGNAGSRVACGTILPK